MLGHERPNVTVILENHTPGEPPTPHLVITIEEYFRMIDELIALIHTHAAEQGWRPNQIVGILGGGFIPARCVSEAFHIPAAYLAVERYRPSGDSDRRHLRAGDDIQFSRHLAMTQPGFGTEVLLVDDLTDEGETFMRTREWLLRHPEFGSGIRTIHTACLWRKSRSSSTSTFSVDDVLPIGGRMPWIDQPLEQRYAKPSVEEIVDRARRRAA